MNERKPARLLNRKALIIAVLLTLLGLAGTIAGFMISPIPAWLWLNISFVIITGIANGMLAWAATFRVAQARWTPVISRVAQSALAFVPVMAVLMVILLAGARYYMPWIEEAVPEKRAWLNWPFLVIRQLFLFAVYWTLCFLMVRWSLKTDAVVLQKRAISQREHYRLNVIAAVVVAVYPIISTVVAWDFIMSLYPEWYSTMFGAYYFCTNIFMAMGVIVLFAAALHRQPQAREYLHPQQFKDIGNLMLGFSLFNMGLFFAQYLTIWYGNLPPETVYLIIRYFRGNWPYPGWFAFILAYAMPFIVLQSRYVKKEARLISYVCVFSLIGFSLERYVLVVPSIFLNPTLISPISASTLALLGGLFVLSLAWFIGRYPVVSAAQEDLQRVNKPEDVTSL